MNQLPYQLRQLLHQATTILGGLYVGFLYLLGGLIQVFGPWGVAFGFLAIFQFFLSLRRSAAAKQGPFRRLAGALGLAILAFALLSLMGWSLIFLDRFLG